MIEDIEDAITLSMNEASMRGEIEENERRLKWAREMIENRGRKQADPAEYDDDDDYDDDDYDADEWYLDDECYPDDE